MSKPKRHWRRVTDDKRRQMIRLAAKGVSGPDIASRVELAKGSVWNVLRPLGGVLRPDMWKEPDGRLTLDDRVEIRLGLERGDSMLVAPVQLTVGLGHARTLARRSRVSRCSARPGPGRRPP